MRQRETEQTDKQTDRQRDSVRHRHIWRQRNTETVRLIRKER
jgi:hypothetical protein